MPHQFTNIVAQDGLSRTQQKNMAKRAARKAKLTAPPAAGPALTAAMTPEQRRRDRELNFLNLRPDVLPQGLLVRYRTLLNRRIEMLTTDNARYEHDLARRTAIGRVIQERIKEGIDYKSDLEIWHSVLKIDDLATWRAKREEHTAWIVQELEKKSGTTRNKGFNVTVEGKLAAYRDLLNVTLTLSNRGGIPKGAEPWLWTSLSSDAASRRGDGDDRAFASWALAAKQAVNYIAACRREAGVVGEFEQTHRHRGHVIEVLASWTKEDLEQEEWVCRDDGEEDDEEDEEILEEKKRAFQLKLGIAAKTTAAAQGEGISDEENGKEGGVSLRPMDSEGDFIAPEPIFVEDFGDDDWEDEE